MLIKPIKSERDHRATLVEIERLWESAPGSAESERLDVLTTLVDAYEREYHALGSPDPVEAIRFRMEQGAVSRKDLEQLLGKSRTSEVLNRRRPLSLEHIRKLHEKLHIPAEVLISKIAPPKPTRKRTIKRKRKAS